MEQSIYRISLEIQASHAQAALDMKRGDTGRRIFITFTDGGNPYPIGEDCYAVFTARKPDENPIFNPCAVAGDTIIYDVTPQTTAAPGRLDCEIKLYGKDDRLITSPAFTITVHEAVFNQGDAPASQPELDALTHLVSQTNTLLTQVRQDLESGALQGEKGDKGEPGPQGEKGEKGDPGDCAIDDTRVGSAAWSAKNIVDRLCPGFSETGPAVVCRPVEGYPLKVVSYIQPTQSGSGDPSPDNIRPVTGCRAVTLQLGIAPDSEEPQQTRAFTMELGQTVYGGSLDWQNGVLTLDWQRLLLNGSEAWAVLGGETNQCLPLGLEGDKLGIARENTALCDRLARGSRDGIPGEFYVSTDKNLQFNVRFFVPKTLVSTNAEWKAYLAENPMEFLCRITQPVTVQLSPRQITALAGDNVLWSDSGNTTVSGKADLTQVIQTLTNAILALGGNI